MKLNETDATLRRIGPLHAVDGTGAAVLGEDFGSAGELEISIAGGAFAAATGAVVEIGNGYYYYQGAAGDAAARPWVTIKIGGVCQEFTIREDVTPRRQAAIDDGEANAALRRIGPLRVVDVSGNAITTLVGITVEVSKNGAAWGAAIGALTLTDDGYVYYTADLSEIALPGWIAVKLTGTAQEFVLREDLGGAGAHSMPDAPTLTVLTTFATDFKAARRQVWQGTLTDWPTGGVMVIVVRNSERNEVITARDADGNWCWPFDITEDNVVDTVSDPATVQLFPRGGWPPNNVEIQICAAVLAAE